MDRRPYLTVLKHLLLFGPVVGAGCCRARGQYKGGGGAGGNDGGPGDAEAGRGGCSRGWGKWVRSGPVDTTEARKVGVYRAFCRLPLGPFLPTVTEIDMRCE